MDLSGTIEAKKKKKNILDSLMHQKGQFMFFFFV